MSCPKPMEFLDRRSPGMSRVVPLPSDRVIGHVEPAQNAVEDHPENGMVEAP